MKNPKNKILVVFFVILVFLLSACVDVSSGGSSTNGKSEAGNTKKTALKEGEEKVVIGYSGPLSGPAAKYGLNALHGLEMAADEINKTGFEIDGTIYKIEIVALDDRYLPNETGVNAKRMVSEKAPVAIWIPHSGGVFATQEFNEQDNFIIMAYTSEPRQYEQGNKFMVGIPLRYTYWSEPFAKYMIEKFGKKMAILPTNSQYGKDWADSVVPVWKELGGEIVYRTEIDFAKETDYFTTMTNALNTNPDVLFVGGPSEPTALVIKQARELGFEGGFMIMDQAKLEEMAGFLGGNEMLNGSIGVLPVESIESEQSKQWVQNFKNLFGEKYATSESALNYQSLYLLVEAMKAAGTVDDRKAIRDAMDDGIKNMPEDHLILPLMGILEDGGLLWDFDAGVVEEGKVVPYKIN